jgi:hypothetical protein
MAFGLALAAISLVVKRDVDHVLVVLVELFGDAVLSHLLVTGCFCGHA